MSVQNGTVVDMESEKALMPQTPVDNVAKEGSVKLLPGVKPKRGSSLRQVLAALCANIGTINTGMAFGFSAVTIPQLLKPESFITITEEQSSWIASLSAVTTPIGCILSGYLMDAVGRRKILLVTQLPMIAGWLTIAFANNVEMIYAGRLLVGLGSGMVGAPSRVYTAEVSQPHLRGMLGALASVGVSLGVAIEYIIGALCTWQTLALLSSFVPMLALVLSFIMPESPSWLAGAGKLDKCQSSLKKLRGGSCDIDHEVGALKSFNEKNNIGKATAKETLYALLHPSAMKPFLILSLYFLIYQFSGVNPVTFYAVEIFQVSGASIDEYLLTVILGLVRLLFTIVGCVLMRICGRRTLTFVSSIGCGVTMISLGSYMFIGHQWKAEGAEPVATWFPVACILLFTTACTVGYLVVPWVMIGEVYPVKVRGIVGGMTTCLAHFCVFIVVKTFPFLQKSITKHGTFWMYGGISLCGTMFFYFCLPETRGRTLQEIEDYFSGRLDSLKKPKKVQIVKTINNNRPIVIKPQKGQSLP